MAVILNNARFFDLKKGEFKNVNIKTTGENGKNPVFSDQPFSNEEDNHEVIDCKGRIVTRAFANGHHHIYSTLARGMPPPEKQPRNFLEILKYIWWNLDRKLDLDMIEASALYAAVDSARNGVTYIIDHHSSPFAVEGSLETIAKAFEKAGVSHLLCYEISDRDGSTITEEAFAETETYLKNHPGLVGLHASFTIGDETLERAVSLAGEYNSGIHIHVAEDLADQIITVQKYGMRVVERLENKGVLNLPKTILAHCIHINEKERDILSNYPAWIVQNTESNLNNNVGLFNPARLDTKTFLGTDGMNGDMIRSTQFAYFAGRNDNNISPAGALQRLMNVNRYLEANGFSNTGQNDFIVWDYNPPTPVTDDNFAGHFIYGMRSSDILNVVSNGQLIIKNRKAVNINEEEIIMFAREAAVRLWKRL